MAHVENSVMIKLALFTAAMFSLPILTYYQTIDRVFDGNATYAAGSAAVVANVVLVAYIIAAMLEDQNPEGKPKEE
ncbi:vacuolar ATPase assembly integral membrane protein VMA21 [Umbelopsis sp. PMI_123]|nr:vacuolar ATPase assembly integral membrane protein VMA21 [Umbelopsis sp. PMI_123]